MKYDEVAKEIKRIYKASGGRIHAPDVIKAARPANSPLHSQFEWNDGKAADEYRLIQARKLIARVLVTIVDGDGGETTIRAYHALRAERNGYRHTRDILEGDDLREMLLSQLADDLRRVRDNYKAVASVAGASAVFQAIEEFLGARKVPQKTP